MAKLERLLGEKELDDNIVTGYKFVSDDMKSYCGSQNWKVGQWYTNHGKVEIAQSGFHAATNIESGCETVQQPYGKERLFMVEARGAVKGVDMFAAREMRLVKEIDLKRLSIDYAINCARHVLPIFESKFPEDYRPRKAIEAAEAYLKDPSESNKKAAESARRAAESSAQSTILANEFAAGYAARSAGLAARFGVWSIARSAAQSAYVSAKFAAGSTARSDAESAERGWQKGLLERLIQKYSL